MKKIIISLVKCFLYILVLGICQIIGSEIMRENALLSTALGDIIFVAVVMVVIKLAQKDIKSRFKLNKVTLKNLGIVILLSLILNVAFQSVQFLFPETMRNELFIVADANVGDVDGVVGFVTMVLIVPFAEEFLVRGLILGELANSFNINIAIVLQAVLFGVMHGNVIWAIIAFLSALLYGYFVKKYNSIFTSVVGHMSVNLLSFMMS